ncbi:MarP family serine protease [Cryobacterium sp. TMT1-3]|uniref:MarP family serine protease n=1 Tax=Cryobacterium luteum TaxID=1424661 RepID=A0A1H8CUA3_9MICO|nr:MULTISPECIES: MarP family serine protease [Cryobacterium]TFB91787.1 MarP family serine protease [Cryobacterium luteum]TFC31240.1 MarP family serine protease [Cryobacterium sp. TMT1-3]SEM98560.1 Trypsin-like peptidase domain-containing protein [Cryobacterium luteum]
MPGSTVLDLVLILMLVVALVNGYRSGLLRSLTGIVGAVIGGIAAFFVVPLVGGWIPAPEWRTPGTIAVAILLVLIGHSLGASVGGLVGSRKKRSPLGTINRVLGAAFAAVASALVASMVAFSIGALGIPFLSPAIASSTVVSGIDSLTPDPVKAFMAQLRSVAVTQGLPRIVDAFTGPTPQAAEADTSSPALALAAQSVVRITGTAYACGQSQSGSGFVVSAEHVITNAHVVAGVGQPVVETPAGVALAGEIVYFDPVDDLAIISVPGLDTAPLTVGENLAAGSGAVADGYPFGGPYVSDPAQVIALGTINVADIYGQDPTPRQVYTLASDVEQGESGGPLLSESGLVVGVIFAKASNTENVGYALALAEVEPVISQASGLSAPVSSGTCVRG